MESWQDLLRQASALRQMNRVEEAIAAYRQLLSVNPDLPDSWYNLGWLQRQARLFDDALYSYEQALELGVSTPEEVHLNRGVIFSDNLLRPTDAERELRAALDKNPGYVPALLNLGNLYEDLGDRQPAKEAYMRALAVAPECSLALARLASVSHSAELDQSIADRLRSGIARRGAPAAEQADLGFALAGLLDAAAQYDEAFEVARAANGASRAAAGTHYDSAATAAAFDRITAGFTHPVVEAQRATHSAPVFICGMYRSGSTLVEQILAAHPSVLSAGELDLIPALVQGLPSYPESVATWDSATIETCRNLYLGAVPARTDGKSLITDKRPDNFLHIGLIKTLFPAAKIVHTLRDPRDNLLSLYFLHLDPGMAYALDLRDAAEWYSQYRRLMDHWKTLYPDDILDVDYDELVRKPRLVIGGLLDFLGLDREGDLLQFHRNPSAVKTASVWQVRQPLHGRSSGRWRNYQRQLQSLGERFGEPVGDPSH